MYKVICSKVSNNEEVVLWETYHRLLRHAKVRVNFFIDTRRDEGFGAEWITPRKAEVYKKEFGTIYYTIVKA